MTDETVVADVEARSTPVLKSESIDAAKAPVTVDTPVQTPKDTEEPADSDDQGDPPANQEPKKSWRDKRIDKLTWEKHELQRELERERAAKATATVVPAGERPKLEDFDFDTERYTEAVAEHAIKRVREADQMEVVKAQQAQAAQEQASQFQDRLAQFEERSPGTWQKVISTDMPTPPELLEIVQARPAGFELAAYLADNVDEARDIARLSPTLRAAEYALIERSLRTDKIEKAIPPKPLATRVPPPVPTLKPKAPIQTPPELESTEDRVKRWRAEERSKKSPR